MGPSADRNLDLGLARCHIFSALTFYKTFKKKKQGRNKL